MENEVSKDPQQVSQDKTIAIIAYLTFIGLVIAFVMNNEKKKIHLRLTISGNRWV